MLRIVKIYSALTMLKFLLTVALFWMGLWSLLYAQHQDRVWVFQDMIRIDFDSTGIKIKSTKLAPGGFNVSRDGNGGSLSMACISDSNGLAVFYARQCSNYSGNQEPDNQACFGDTVNGPLSARQTNLISNAFDLKHTQISNNGIVIVDIADNRNEKYHMFTHYYNDPYKAYSDTSNWPPERGLYWHRIDRDPRYDSLDHRLVMTKKNIPIYKGALAEKFIAVRHANGKDWWLIGHKLGNNEFVLFRMEGDTAYYSHSCKAGSPHSLAYFVNRIEGMEGEICASRYTSPFIGLVTHLGLAEVLTFDRTTGMLQLFESVAAQNSQQKYGCALSADGSKFYYTWKGNSSLRDRVYQYNLNELDQDSAQTLIGASKYQAGLYQMELTPHDQILIGCHAVSLRGEELPVLLAGIRYPDSAGLKCGYDNGFIDTNLTDVPIGFVGLRGYGYLPNMPNFRLQDLSFPLVIDAGADQTVCMRKRIRLGKVFHYDHVKYKWSPNLYLSNDSIAQPVFQTPNLNRDTVITYVLTAEPRAQSYWAGHPLIHDTVAITIKASTSCIPAGRPNNTYVKDGFHIIPNPTNGSFRLQLSEVLLPHDAEIEIFNWNGQRVYHTHSIVKNSFVDVEVSFLPAGIYAVRYTTSNGKSSFQKLIIQ